jgi:hypothetical protein
MPEEENLSKIGFLCLSKCSVVFLVRNAVFRSMCLNALVIYNFSLPIYIKNQRDATWQYVY